MASRVHTYSLSSGGSYLSVIAKRAYRMKPGGRATPLAEEAPILSDPEYADSINKGARPRLVHVEGLRVPAPREVEHLVQRHAHRAEPEFLADGQLVEGSDGLHGAAP